jgi:anti-sigma factor RsiW
MPMNCDLAIEYLPWLLNGTLEAGERDEVRRHLATCESCRAALNDTREAWTTFGQHLPSDALVALAYGEAPAGVDPEVAARHLAGCPECAAELELARTSRHLEEDDRIAVFPGAKPPQSERVPERPDRSRRWRVATIAAGLLAAVTSAGWVHQLQQAGDAGRIARATPPAAAAPAAADDPLRKQLDTLVASFGQLKASQEETERRARQDETQLAEIKKQYELPRPGTFAILDTPDVVRGAEPQPAAAPKEVPRSSLPFILLLQAAKEGEGPTGRKAEIVDAAGTTLRVQDTSRPTRAITCSLSRPAS